MIDKLLRFALKYKDASGLETEPLIVEEDANEEIIKIIRGDNNIPMYQHEIDDFVAMLNTFNEMFIEKMNRLAEEEKQAKDHV